MSELRLARDDIVTGTGWSSAENEPAVAAPGESGVARAPASPIDTPSSSRRLKESRRMRPPPRRDARRLGCLASPPGFAESFVASAADRTRSTCARAEACIVTTLSLESGSSAATSRSTSASTTAEEASTAAGEASTTAGEASTAAGRRRPPPLSRGAPARSPAASWTRRSARRRPPSRRPIRRARRRRRRTARGGAWRSPESSPPPPSGLATSRPARRPAPRPGGANPARSPASWPPPPSPPG